MARRVQPLFVDEAHHVAAPSWRQMRDLFAERPVVQFTATPYREDGKRLGGRIIYEFPLREAQAEGYFAEIDYTSVSTRRPGPRDRRARPRRDCAGSRRRPGSPADGAGQPYRSRARSARRLRGTGRRSLTGGAA